MYYRNAAQRCLTLPEIIHEIGRYLTHPDDLLDASFVNKLWRDVLVPLRSHFPHVYLKDLPSFLLFLKSNPRAAYSCNGLRILADEWEDDTSPFLDEGDFDTDMEDEDGEGEEDPDVLSARTQSTPAETPTSQAIASPTEKTAMNLHPLSDIFDYLADRGGLEFFMYALPGEPYAPLPDKAWKSLSRLSSTLQGMYIELVGAHWIPFLTTTFSKLRYLRLFLDSDDFEVNVSAAQRTDPNRLLLDFLRAHPLLEVLHIYLGKQFVGLSFNTLRLPRIRSFLLISKAEDVSVATFLKNHPGIIALDAFTDSAIEPFARTDLPNVRSLQVSALTASWFTDVIAAVPQRKPEQKIHHLQITAARHSNLEDVLRIVAPLGPTLRCLELIFWTREGQVEMVLESVKRVFPNLVELSLFIPSWSVSDEEGSPAPLNLATILQSFAGSNTVRALSISDPHSDHVTVEEIESLIASVPSPPNLQYVAWRSQTFSINKRHVHGELDRLDVRAKQIGHPRNYRGRAFLRDWYEEMLFDHIAGDYEEQLKVMPQ